jgi:hypothetical protein
MHRFWAFLYVQNRHDICKTVITLLGDTVLTINSACPKLHYRNPCLLDCRATDDLGLLWYAILSRCLSVQQSNFSQTTKTDMD